MAGLNSQISALLSLGADAMDNLFDVSIELPTSISGALKDSTTTPGITTENYTKPFALRCQGFDPPHFTLKTYDVRYKTIGIKRPAARIEGERIFKLQFRLDAYYNIYRILLAWRNLVMQPSTGFAATAIYDFDLQSPGTITVAAIDVPIGQKTGAGYNANGVSRGYTQATISGDAAVNAPATDAQLKWLFNDVWISDLDEPKFKTGGGESQIVTATFVFGDYMDPSAYDTYSNNGAGTTRKLIKT